nr:hypothetical protein [Streptomyces xanthophaeus]
MRERKFFDGEGGDGLPGPPGGRGDEHNEQLYEREFSLCEH